MLNVAPLSDLLWPWLAIWFFNTAAGRTFLEGRAGQPLSVARDAVESLYWISFLFHPVAAGAAVALAQSANEYFGTETDFNDAIALFTLHSIVAFLAHFYRQWPVSSLAVFAVFSITAAILGPIVVWLAYISDAYR